MKKTISLFLLTSMLFTGIMFITGCGSGRSEVTEAVDLSNDLTTSGRGKDQPATDYSTKQAAAQMIKNVFRRYGMESGSGSTAVINLREYYNSNQSGYLWSNFCGVGMQYYVCKLYPDDEEQKTVFLKMINNLKYFRQSYKDSEGNEIYVKYHSGRGSAPDKGQGDCYFDDNIWVARNFLRAFEIFGDESYIEEAKKINTWVLKGWNDDIGGIVWSELGLNDNANEQHLERGLSANACGIIVNAMLSDLAQTEEEKAFHMEWALKFYNFCKKMQNTPATFDYWNGIHTIIVDGVRKDGSVNKVHYSYNSGSMILADLLLYELTDDEEAKAEYLRDARGTSAAANRTFYQIDPKNGKRYIQGDPWFAAILCEAYYELYKYDPENAGKYLSNFSKNVQNAFENRDTKTGLCPYHATQKNTWEHNEAYVIHQVGVAQQAVIVALYEKTNSKS